MLTQEIHTILHCALPCEARPIVRHFQLERQQTHTAFDVYAATNMICIVSGVGALNAAAAVSYAAAQYRGDHKTVFVNIGLAGGNSFSIGDWVMAHTVSMQNQRSFIPWITPYASKRLAPLWTVPCPQENMEELCVYDMEAYGFFQSAQCFAPLDFIHCAKVISDHGGKEMQNLSSEKASNLIENGLSELEDCLQRIHRFCQTDHQVSQSLSLDLFENKWHLTHSNRLRLKEMLRRWRILRDDEPFEKVKSCSNPKVLFESLERILDESSYRWNT